MSMSVSPAFITEFKGKALSFLFAPHSDDAKGFASWLVEALLLQFPEIDAPLAGLPAEAEAGHATALHAGRNMALPDPESAYRMMSLINGKEALYKAQFWELSQMGAEVVRLQRAGQRLANVETENIKPALQEFVSQYNSWIQSFEADWSSDGLLGGMQAAQISRYELEQSVRNIFIGASHGLRGVGSLGVAAGPDGALSLDEAKLDIMLLENAKGAESTIREFGAHFAKSAELLNNNGNFIPRQLDNLNRAIYYIADNHAAWQAEFGTGDTAQPAGQVAKALAAYQQAGGI